MATHINHMGEVAKILGVNLKEEFKINGFKDGTDTFLLTEEGLYDTENCPHSSLLADLLTGGYTIKHLPWKPRINESYWFIDEKGCIYQEGYGDIDTDILRYKIGNCYPTEEDAEANREKWLAFFASDEILEV